MDTDPADSCVDTGAGGGSSHRCHCGPGTGEELSPGGRGSDWGPGAGDTERGGDDERETSWGAPCCCLWAPGSSLARSWGAARWGAVMSQVPLVQKHSVFTRSFSPGLCSHASAAVFYF